MPPKTPQTEALWRDFLAASGIEASGYEVAAFGDSPQMATELAELVVAGTKRATASLARDYGEGRAPLPKAGDFVVVVDGRGAPRCIWRTTEAKVQPLDAADQRFAWDEGEGKRTLAGWLAAHRRYFARQAAREGFAMNDAIATVFERFEVVWPPALADRGGGETR